MQKTPTLNDRQRRFADLVAAGEPLGKAYQRAGFASRGRDANNAASRLLKKPQVVAYLETFRQQQREEARVRRDDMLQFYEDVILTPPAAITPDSPLAQICKETSGEKGTTREIRMVDKLRAAEALRRMRGWDQPTHHHHTLSDPEAIVRKIMFGE